MDYGQTKTFKRKLLKTNIFSGMEFHFLQGICSFCKGHCFWKILKSIGNFEGALQPRPRATEARASVPSFKPMPALIETAVNLGKHSLQGNIFGKDQLSKRNKGGKKTKMS